MTWTLAVFGILAAIMILLSRRHAVRETAALERFAAGQGWTFYRNDAPGLSAVLEEMDPERSWFPRNIVMIAWPPQSVYLFGFTSRRRERERDDWNGFACLAEPTSRAAPAPVSIYRRLPLPDVLLGGSDEVGVEEFRREFRVDCSQLEAARAIVNEEVQRILLEHIAGPGYYVTVRIAGQRVLLTSAWTQNPSEWDYLIQMTRRLRAAIR